jgi:competence protein ComGC
MTLTELVVVITIIALLVTMVTVSFNGVKKHFTRADCKARHNVFARAADQYSLDHGLKYVQGSVGSPEVVDENGVVTEEAVPDNYAYMNSFAYRDLLIYGLSDQDAMCATISETEGLFGDTEELTGSDQEPEPITGYQIGFVYWLGREDILDPDGNVVYQSRKRGDASYDMSSRTLATCLCYDGNSPVSGGGGSSSTDGSFLPHLSGGSARYPAAVMPNPWDSDEPEGLVVSHLDQSVTWVPFNELAGIMQLNYIWYDAK